MLMNAEQIAIYGSAAAWRCKIGQLQVPHSLSSRTKGCMQPCRGMHAEPEAYFLLRIQATPAAVAEIIILIMQGRS